MGARHGDRTSSAPRTSTQATTDAAPSRPRTRPRASISPSSTAARVGFNLLPPRRRGRSPKTSSLPGRVRQPAVAVRTSPLPAEAAGDRGRPIVVRYGFTQAEPNLPRSPLPARPEPRVPSLAASVVDDAELHVDPPASWVMEKPQPRISTRPTREVGYARPGCWNCGEFGYSRIDCTLPRQRMCYMCGRPGLTIATCPTCCQDWGQRRRAEMQREPQ